LRVRDGAGRTGIFSYTNQQQGNPTMSEAP